MEETKNSTETSQSETDDSDRTLSDTLPAEFAAPPIDEGASEIVKQITGEEKVLVAAIATPVPSSEKVKGLK